MLRSWAVCRSWSAPWKFKDLQRREFKSSVISSSSLLWECLNLLTFHPRSFVWLWSCCDMMNGSKTALTTSQRESVDLIWLDVYVQTPFHSGANVLISKQYYGMLQYSRYIKNGWTILGTNHSDTTLAAISPAHANTQAVVVVITNFDGAGDIKSKFSQPNALHACRQLISFSLEKRSRVGHINQVIEISSSVSTVAFADIPEE